MTIKDDILDRIDLISLAEEAGAQLRGGAWKISRCPLPRHAGDRSSLSFSIEPEGKRWKCWSACPSDANGGNAIDFYMAWRGVDFKTALDQLADRVQVDRSRPAGQRQPDRPVQQPRPFRESHLPDPAWVVRAEAFVNYARTELWKPAGQDALRWLREERGLTDETIRTARLGFNPKDYFDDPARWGDKSGDKVYCALGVVIPETVEGEIAFVQIRRPLPGDSLAMAIGRHVTVKQGEKPFKYISLRGGKRGLYGIDDLTDKPIAVLTEGEFDRLLAWQAAGDLADFCTIGGARMLLDVRGAASLLGKIKIIATYDADTAGDAGRNYLHQITARIENVTPPAHDLTDYWRDGGNLRAWLAEHIARRLDGIIAGIDEEAQPEAFVRFLELYDQARQASSAALRQITPDTDKLLEALSQMDITANVYGALIDKR